MSDLVNEWTDEMTPLLVMKVPRMARRKLMMTSDRFHTRSIFLRSSIITECRKAVQGSHGMSEAFSTGAQAQNASLIPWLTCTPFLRSGEHTSVLQSRSGLP